MTITQRKDLPRLPLDGNIDLTYRCNNTCRHCWLWLPSHANEQSEELSFAEWRKIIDQARAMGCQAWSISGGEPMLREDFTEIFDYITRKSVHYSINTNGTLITPEIARLMTRNGRKLVALYGATSEIHDHITRSPGSFEATMRGFAYLKEAGANFIVQIIPMRDNFHQYEEMVTLAQSLSKIYRIGSPWLWLSFDHNQAHINEIKRQRLDPMDVLKLDEPDPTPIINPADTNFTEIDSQRCSAYDSSDDRLFASCIASRRDFHIDPYGKMSFCVYIKDPSLRYDLRKGSFQEAWDEFIPSLAEIVRGGQEYLDNCGSCDLRKECRWCAVYSYLEHGRYTSKVDYLCQVAKEVHQYQEDWKLTHLQYYQIAGITIQLSADFPLTDEHFHPKFAKFRVDGPGEETISIKLTSPLPSLSYFRLGQEIFRRPPWAIYRQRDSYIYIGTSSENNEEIYNFSITDSDHSNITIFQPEEIPNKKNLSVLTVFPSDQILLAPMLAYRQACYLHSAGIIINDQGFLFIGHSEAGKSTTLKMLRGHGEILCDDRNIVRRWPEGYRVHGTWNHGELPDVSSASAPLRALIFLEQSNTNELIELTDRRERFGLVLSHVVKPLLTQDWWDKILNLAWNIAGDVPAYRLRFDLSGKVYDTIAELL
jgi:MoaA/NifB/PqqE/SkfB family radical SAM enzyme